MDLKILGTGCKNCQALTKNAEDAIRELGIEANIEKVEDIAKIAKWGIMKTPGLVINGKVKTYGRVPDKDEIVKLIQEEM
jgi:small redox-active disulfide protein 2